MFWITLLACAPEEMVEEQQAPTEVTPVPSPAPPTAVVPPTPSEPASNGYDFLPADYTVIDPTLVVFMGDSIMKGEGGGPDRGVLDLLHDDDGAIYEAYVDDDLLGWFPSIEHAVDVAVSGGTTNTLVGGELDGLFGWMDHNLPEGPEGQALFVITIGGNDMQQGLLPGSNVARLTEDTLANIEATVRELQDPVRFPNGSRIYVTNVYEPSDGTGQSSCFFGFDYSDKIEPLDTYNTRLHDLGEALGFAVIDLNGHFRGHGANHQNSSLPDHDADDPTRWFALDCIHPNNRGHHEIRRLFLGALAGQLGPFTP